MFPLETDSKLPEETSSILYVLRGVISYVSIVSKFRILFTKFLLTVLIKRFYSRDLKILSTWCFTQQDLTYSSLNLSINIGALNYHQPKAGDCLCGPLHTQPAKTDPQLLSSLFCSSYSTPQLLLSALYKHSTGPKSLLTLKGK